MHPRLPSYVFLLAAALLAAAPLPAQNIASREAPPDIPFDDWIAETKRVELPVSIHISPARLSILQRLVVEFRVMVPSKTLYLLGPRYQLFLEVRLKPAGAGWLKTHDIAGTRVQERLPKGHHLQFSLRALVLPGEYTVGFILFDRISGMRSVALRKLRVRPLSSDPLPEISRDLPMVEFFQRSVDEASEVLPELHSRLWIPLATRRPVRVELLVNFAAPEPVASMPPGNAERLARNLRSLHQRNVAHMLGIIKVFSEMELANGALHITAFDLFRRSVLFEQEAAGVDWPRLLTALGQVNPLSIPAKALAGRRQNAVFLRNLLEQRLPATAPAPVHAGNGGNGGSDAGAPAVEPLRVFIVVSSPVIFERGTDLTPVRPPRGSEFRVYHLQYQLSAANLWDDLPRVLRGLGPRRFDIKTPEEFRRALARILADLRAL